MSQHNPSRTLERSLCVANTAPSVIIFWILDEPESVHSHTSMLIVMINGPYLHLNNSTISNSNSIMIVILECFVISHVIKMIVVLEYIKNSAIICGDFTELLLKTEEV